jgi:hypothetical protein
MLVSAIAAGLVTGAVAVDPVSLAGQSRSNLPGAAAHAQLVARVTAKGYTVPKTPWGHPDLQGIFTTKDEMNTPYERPDEWAGRRMEDITPKEFAAALERRQQNAQETAPFAGGGEPEEGIAIAVPIHWFDNLMAKNTRPWFVIDPPEGKVPAISAAGKSRTTPRRGISGGGRDSYADRNLGDRCIAMTLRAPALYGNSYEILQTPDYVVIRREQMHDARMIPIDGRPHVHSSIRSHEGDSRGRWEGNTLVIETRNYHPDMVARGFGPEMRYSDKVRVIERYTRTSPTTVEMSVTLDDPETYARDWTYSMPLTLDNTQMIHEYACHEGNFGLANLLTAGRRQDTKTR